MFRRIALAMMLTFLPIAGVGAEMTLDLEHVRLTLDQVGNVTGIRWKDGETWPVSPAPAIVIETAAGIHVPESVVLDSNRLTAAFAGGAVAEFSVHCEPGVAVLRLEQLSSPQPVTRFQLFALPLPPGAERNGTLNGARTESHFLALMAGEPNVHAVTESAQAARADRAGCRHQFTQVGDDVKAGSKAGRFAAECNEQPGGWSMRGRQLTQPLDLSGLKAIRAWVRGDGRGQSLKIQLHDGSDGYRDDYLAIDFEGWRQVTLATPALNTLQGKQVRTLNFYYNGLPPSTSVCCLLDQVEAIVERDGQEQVVLLEDFESAASPLWASPLATLKVQTYARHGVEPAALGIVACPTAEAMETIRRMEVAAGIPSPRPGGEWNKRSPWINRSYFFLTRFSERQFDEALAIARRGGFHTILIDQGSWCRATGHYEINRDHFPDGIEGLQRTVERFHDAGFRVGLHFLGPSIYPPDAYFTPVPDPRLVKDATVALAADIDEKADFLPTLAAPEGFPEDDGGYTGDGTVLQIGNELIVYGERSMTPPYGFRRCRRGHLGTQPAPHRQGEAVAHLARSYGYHMFDMDTSLLDEVATHFARVANACKIDMIYFDGSERLQGDHWYYNAKLHKTFYDKLDNKDMLIQASSFSHYSWHILARSASADGHGDLKGYLDERSPWFGSFAAGGMPLDIGWYYGYDTSATPDMYEYVLGATIGYGASMSFQVSPDAAAKHPFTGDILDLIARYEKLRLSGRVPAEMQARLRIDPELGGQKTPEERAKLLDRRREYRLLGGEGQEVFQRVIYEPWREVSSSEAAEAVWPLNVSQGPARAGVQIQAVGGPWLRAGAAYDSTDALMLEDFDDLAPYTRDSRGRTGVKAVGPGESGSVLPGVTQRLKISDDGAPAGGPFAVYTAESRLADNGGWSAIGRQFDPPLDISWHRGIGFWLRGDGRGGAFKLQLRDGSGAMDYYVQNDFAGWRYQQLVRPEKDAIDYAQLRSLTLYYNGLPGKTSVACGIDDVKALRRLDERQLVDPWVEIDGKRFAWQGQLEEGQYLIFWPGEPTKRYGMPLVEPETVAAPAEDLVLPAGEHTIRFGCQGGPALPVRVRATLQPPEQHRIP